MTSTHTKTAYVVDDDPHISALLGRILTEAGFRVLEFPLPKPALSTVLSAPPDLLMVDLLLPGMNGVELVSEIRAHLRDFAPPIVLVSGSVETLSPEEMQQFDSILPKPFRLQQLRDVVRRFSGEEPGRRVRKRTSGAQLIDGAPALSSSNDGEEQAG